MTRAQASRAPAHFIQYIPRRIVTRIPADPASPWYSRQQPDDAGFFHPQAHVLAGDVVAAQVEPGDTVWVIGQLFGPVGAGRDACLPVALDARIAVAARYQAAGGGHDVVPGPGSCWFGLADATALLGQLSSITASGKRSSLAIEPGTRVGGRFQCLRRLADAEPLLAWAQWLAEEPFDFISYRHADGQQAAFDLARRLVADERRVVYWDRWSLPRRLAERRELVSEDRLNACLMACLRQARRVHGIASPAYDEPGSYSGKEADAARALGRFQAVPWVAAARAAQADPWRVRPSGRVGA